jgi:hypothetical protein
MRRLATVLCALAAILAGGAAAAQARDVYVDPLTGDDTAAGDTPGTAVATLARAGRDPLGPGDRVLLARGTASVGTLRITGGGTKAAPILVAPYGTGAAPQISHPGPFNDVVVDAPRVTVQGLALRDTSTGYTRRFDKAGTPGPQDSAGAVLVTRRGVHVVLDGLDVRGVGEGAKLYGPYAEVRRSTFADLVMAFQGHDPQLDRLTSYGAIGVASKGPHQRITANTFRRCRAPSRAFGHDGGAVEVEAIHATEPRLNRSLRIDHNTSLASNGFVEADTNGAWTGGRVDHNVSRDYQDFMLMYVRATVRIDHNTVDRTLHEPTDKLDTGFGLRGSDGAGLTVTDNVFRISRGPVWTHKRVPRLRGRNLYWRIDRGDAVGAKLHASERVADPRFVDPGGMDYRRTGGPLPDAGAYGG